MTEDHPGTGPEDEEDPLLVHPGGTTGPRRDPYLLRRERAGRRLFGAAWDEDLPGAPSPPPGRGTSASSAASPTTTASRVIEKVDVRLSVAPLPETIHGYVNWRYNLGAEILGCGVDPLAAMMYLAEVDAYDEEKPDDDFESLGKVADADVRRLDVKLFTGILRGLKDTRHLQYFSMQLKFKLVVGCGVDVRRCVFWTYDTVTN